MVKMQAFLKLKHFYKINEVKSKHMKKNKKKMRSVRTWCKNKLSNLTELHPQVALSEDVMFRIDLWTQSIQHAQSDANSDAVPTPMHSPQHGC